VTSPSDGGLRLAALTYAHEQDVRNNKIEHYDRRDQPSAQVRAIKALDKADVELRVAAVRSVVELVKATGADPELGAGHRVSTYLERFIVEILKNG